MIKIALKNFLIVFMVMAAFSSKACDDPAKDCDDATLQKVKKYSAPYIAQIGHINTLIQSKKFSIACPTLKSNSEINCFEIAIQKYAKLRGLKTIQYTLIIESGMNLIEKSTGVKKKEKLVEMVELVSMGKSLSTSWKPLLQPSEHGLSSENISLINKGDELMFQAFQKQISASLKSMISEVREKFKDSKNPDIEPLRKRLSAAEAM